MFDTKDPRSFDLQQVAHNIKTINYCLCDSFSGATLVSWPMLASVWPNWPIHISAISVQFRIPDFMETSRHKACLAMPHYNSECHHLLRPLYRVDSLDSDGSLLNQSCILAYNIQPTIIYLPGFTVGAGRQQTRIRGRIRKTRRQLARGPETTSQGRAAQCHVSLGSPWLAEYLAAALSAFCWILSKLDHLLLILVLFRPPPPQLKLPPKV